MTLGKPRNLTALELEAQMQPQDCLIDNHANSVQSGCEVTASEQPGFTVSVAPGICRINGREVVTDGAGCIHLTEQDSSLHRLDLIVCDASGHVSAVTGAASTHPKYPQTTAYQCVLASVYVPPFWSYCTGTDSSLVIDRR